MAEFKDIIPMGNDNDSNSADSWFVLSSASEEEDDESADEMPDVIQLENCQKKPQEKETEAVSEKPKLQLEKLQEKAVEKKENETVSEKPKLELEKLQEKAVEKKENEVVSEKPKLQLEKLQEKAVEKKENEPTLTEEKVAEQLEKTHNELDGEIDQEPASKKPRILQQENFQKDTVEKENNFKAEKMAQIGNCQSLTGEEKKNIPANKESTTVPLEISQAVTVGEKENVAVHKETPMAQLETLHKEKNAEKPNNEKSGIPIEQECKNVQKDKHEKPEPNNEKSGIPIEQEYKNVQKDKHEKPEMAKHKRKPKGPPTDEESHSEIALEVHALRETLIQLSLNLSNTEQEKYTAITSEVQALRETVNQLNNDISNRISQIERRTEQVHTLLCRFIMTRYGSCKEPIAQVVNTVKEHHLDTSHAAVQTEMLDIKHTPKTALSEGSAVSYNQNMPPNENRETASTVNILSHNDKSEEVKLAEKDGVKSNFSCKEYPDSHGLKRPRSDGESSQASKESPHSSDMFEESYSSSTLSKRDESNKFSKDKAYHNRHKPRHSNIPTENYRYSSENDRRQWRKAASNRPWQSGNRKRQHPYSKMSQGGQDVCSSNTEKPMDEFHDGLDDYMDKVIDEWAQDEDDCYEVRPSANRLVSKDILQGANQLKNANMHF